MSSIKRQRLSTQQFRPPNNQAETPGEDIFMDQLDDGFWTFRGSFKIGGVLDIGTHMSLVRRASGRFVLIDSYSLGDDDRRQLMSLTDNGRAIEAVLNVHPFHTLHCAAVHRMIPHAKLYGTRRHHTACDGLPWQAEAIEAPATQQLFA